MSAETAFIDAILEAPEDETLSLIYADWLDESGDARGELIRLQWELDHVPLGNPQRQVLRLAIRNLCEQNHFLWLTPLRRRVLGWQHARVHFGLIENVAMSPAAFLKHAQSGLFEEMPHLVGVALEGAENSLAKALSSPYILRLKSLSLRLVGMRSGQLFDRLASLSTVGNLTSLNLCDGRFGDKAIATLLQSSSFHKLRRLSLRNNSLTSAIAKPLIESPFAGQLEYLALGSRWQAGANRLEDAGVRALTESTTPLRFRWLDLSANNLSDSSAWDLSKSTCLDNIERLDLGGNTFGRASRNALEACFSGRVFHAHCEPECICQ